MRALPSNEKQNTNNSRLALKHRFKYVSSNKLYAPHSPAQFLTTPAVLTVFSMPTDVALLVSYDASTRRKELAV